MKHEIAVKTVYDQDLSFYKEFIQTLKIPILLIDENGHIIYSNRAVQLLTGYTENELRSMIFDDLFASGDKDKKIFDKIKMINNIDGIIKVRHQESPEIAAKIKMYDFRPNNRRSHYYQVILRDFYYDQDIDTLRKPLSLVTEQLKKMNDELEHQLEELKKDAGISTKRG